MKKTQYLNCFFISVLFQTALNYKIKAALCFIMKILNKRELQQIASNNLSDIDFKDFMKLYKDYTKEPYPFLMNDATFS